MSYLPWPCTSTDTFQPNGTLGPPVISNLLKAGFEVTVLTRNAEKTKEAFPEAKVAEADYSSIDNLTSILKSAGKVDAVVCLINRGPQALSAQKTLIDATIAAGVPHYIPSSFGADMRVPPWRDLPPLQAKRDMEDYVLEKANEEALTFTVLNQGFLLDWGLHANVLLNFDGGPIRIFDYGKAMMSATTLDDVGRAVANALKKRDEFINKYCFIHSIATNQLQMLRLLQELKPDEKVETVDIDTMSLLKEAEENVRKGDLSPFAMRGFLLHVGFGQEGNYFKETDNEILGIQEWSEQQLKDLIAKHI